MEAGAGRERGMLSRLSRVLVAWQVTLRPHWREQFAVQLFWKFCATVVPQSLVCTHDLVQLGIDAVQPVV